MSQAADTMIQSAFAPPRGCFHSCGKHRRAP